MSHVKWIVALQQLEVSMGGFGKSGWDAAVGEYKYECTCTLVAFTSGKINTIII